MLPFSFAAFLLALAVTMVEMTEVVALVFALRGESDSIRHGVLGALSGTALVGGIALVTGAYLAQIPSTELLAGSAIVLAGFGVFLFRSTLRTYRRARAPSAPSPASAAGSARAIQFAGGFTVGVVETIEAVIVLVSIAAAGQGAAALLGAFVAGIVLVGAAVAVHEQIRRIKIPLLKLGATSLLFAFAVFWAGEAAGVAWPYGDLVLVPLFLAALVVVRAALEATLRLPARPMAR